jgi:predicted nuclease of restriction endonuclease-like RecB superfamily
LLDDAITFEQARPARPAALRRTVFRQASAMHPLVRTAGGLFEHEEMTVKADIAARLGRTWDEIDRDLFADVIDFHRLREFEGYPDAAALLARYNVAQAQVALFAAVSLTVWASDDYKTILRYAKLARLMHTIERDDGGNDSPPNPMGGSRRSESLAPGSSTASGKASRYVIRFDGPASILRETRRYGVAMAKFLPALIACRGWRLHAVIQTPRRGWAVALDLSPADRLNSHLPPPSEFDSDVESAFVEKWGSEKREGWSLHREAEILHDGQKVFIPDFVFRHEDGRRVLMEIVGFWTPEYLEAKLDTLRRFRSHRILVAVAEDLEQRLAELPTDNIIRFKSAVKIKDVLDRLRLCK